MDYSQNVMVRESDAKWLHSGVFYKDSRWDPQDEYKAKCEFPDGLELYLIAHGVADDEFNRTKTPIKTEAYIMEAGEKVSITDTDDMFFGKYDFTVRDNTYHLHVYGEGGYTDIGDKYEKEYPPLGTIYLQEI